MIWWTLAVTTVALCSYLTDVEVITIFSGRVPFIGGSTISVLLMVCCIGMLVRIARLSRRGDRESMKNRVSHLEGEIKNLANLPRKQTSEK